jgi:hypothetical protein
MLTLSDANGDILVSGYESTQKVRCYTWCYYLTFNYQISGKDASVMVPPSGGFNRISGLAMDSSGTVYYLQLQDTVTVVSVRAGSQLSVVRVAVIAVVPFVALALVVTGAMAIRFYLKKRNGYRSVN